MKKPARIDVVICTKNNAKTLGSVLKRIVKYVPMNRLIVIDGGSNDGTVEIAKKFGAEVYFDGGKGLGYARNMALKHVETPIFAFIDSDALIPYNWIKLMRHFNDQKVAVASGFTFFGPEHSILKALYKYQLRRYKFVPVSLSNALLRLDYVKEVKGIREDLPSGEDRDLYEKLTKKGYKWIVDRSIITYQPRDLKQHLAHVRWWGRGDRAIGHPITEPAWFLIKSPFTAIAMLFSAHPALLIYYPLLKLQGYLGYLDEVKAKKKKCN